MQNIPDIDVAEFLGTDFLSCEILDVIAQKGDDVEESSELPKYITNYIGSKQKLIDWIWQNTPEDVKSVFDAFGGSNVVGFLYKRKGLKVFTNDLLRYSYHISRAIIENNSTKLSEEEIDNLIIPKSNASDFIQRNFKNTFFTPEVLNILDGLRANIDSLKGYKKDIALFALGKTCISGGGGFGHFQTTAMYRRFTKPKFLELYKSNLTRISDLVFDNGQDNKAYNGEILDIAPEVKADLAYFDPPYATHFSTTNYETAYHFVEGLMTMWKGKEIKEDSKTKTYEITSKTVTEKTANEFFENYLNASKHIKYWIISYRDNAYPSERKIKTIIDDLNKDSRMKSRDHHYSLSSAHGENSDAKEHIFVCGPRGFLHKAKAGDNNAKESLSGMKRRNCHTSLTCDAHLNSKAKEGDPQFSFILTHAGTNANGDHFLASELKTKHETVVEKKIDLKHSQDITDIVGGVISSEYKEENGGIVECTGELYVQDNPHAQLAYKLLKKGIIKQVSMECDYEEGECSICGRRVKSRGDDCVHLKKYKGQEYKGKKVYEVLHNITFTGLGLLDRAGADENAKILAVANNKKEDIQMSEKDKTPDTDNKSSDLEAKIKDQSEKLVSLQSEADQKDDRIKQLEEEVGKITKELEKANKQIESLELEKKTQAQKSKAETLLKRWEELGRKFESEDDRSKELNRLAEMNEDAIKAVEETITSMTELNSGSENGDKSQEKSSKASMRTDAGVKPEAVDDGDVTLKDELSKGFMEAYKSRIAN